MKRTKIVCTIGPASNSPKVLRQMLNGGLNVARLNFSHGSHEDHGKTIDLFRKIRDELDIAAAVLLDTKGPEIRLKNFRDGAVELVEGQTFTLTNKEIDGDKNMVAITYSDLYKELNVDDKVMLDDGKLVLKVKKIQGENIICDVVIGGKVSNHKGVNVPHAKLNMPYISEVDRGDILFGIEKDVDYVAASFVRRKSDVEALRKLLDENGGEYIKIISKIENGEGVENFEDILEASDGIMVARGDMGVEIDFELLPGIQKKLIKRCKESGKICITATQMLESMIKNASPTRAEITDVANAVYDGTAAVMLSGETAMGEYPVEAVKAMSKIAGQAEDDMDALLNEKDTWHEMDKNDVTNAVGRAACNMSKDIAAKAILAITKSGYTATRMAKFRPDCKIIGATPFAKVYHQLALEWGVIPIIAAKESNLEELMQASIDISISKKLLQSGDKIVVSAGLPLNVSGTTNMIRVIQI